MADLTPDEIAFFATGELPAALQGEADAAAAAAAAPAVAEPAPAAPAAATAVAAPAETTAPAAPADTTTALLERFMAEERAQRTTLETKLAELQTQLAERAKPAEPEAPDEGDDPLGAMLHTLKAVNTQVQALETRLTTEQQNNLLKQQFEQFTNSVRATKEAFEATTPDFKDAYAHIRAIRTADLQMAGAPEADIPKILLQDELQIAQNAIQRGKNPAEEMYNMAKRYGYAAKAAPAIAPDAATKIAALKAGMEAAKTIPAAGTESELTLAGLKDASNADLNKLVQNDDMWEKVVGGASRGPDIF